jgi:hypothetical protein
MKSARGKNGLRALFYFLAVRRANSLVNFDSHVI